VALSQRQLQVELERLVTEKNASGLETTIVVCCRDRRAMLLDVSTAITHEASNIISVQSEIFTRGAESAFQYRVMLANREQLQRLIGAVQAVEDVTLVSRGSLQQLRQRRRDH